MSELPSSMSSTEQSIALIREIRSLKQSSTDRATAFGIVTSVASDTVQDATRATTANAQATAERLALVATLPENSRELFTATTLDVDSKMANAISSIAEQSAKLLGKL